MDKLVIIQILWHVPSTDFHWISFLNCQQFKWKDLCVGPLHTTDPIFSIMSVNENEVSHTKRLLKSSRTKEIFGIHTLVLKELSSTLTIPLTIILNPSISGSIHPSAWKWIISCDSTPQKLRLHVTFKLQAHQYYFYSVQGYWITYCPTNYFAPQQFVLFSSSNAFWF